MANELKNAADAILNGTVTGTPRVPGVVAMATDRRGNIYEGAAGKRVLGQDADMTTDAVFAIFSTTKAITGTAAWRSGVCSRPATVRRRPLRASSTPSGASSCTTTSSRSTTSSGASSGWPCHVSTC